MHQLAKGKFVHGVDQRSLSAYAATVTVVLAMITDLYSAVLLLLMSIRYMNVKATTVGCLSEANIQNFVLRSYEIYSRVSCMQLFKHCWLQIPWDYNTFFK